MRRTLITERPGRTGWFENFQVRGRRFRDRIAATTRADAEAVAAATYAAAKAGAAGPKSEAAKGRITLGEALGQYWKNRGAHVRSARDIKRQSETLIAELGNETPLEAIGTRELEDYVARRRVRRVKDAQSGKMELKDRANASINREMALLRSVVVAAKHWQVRMPEIAWNRVFLPEPDRKQLILSVAKEVEFFEALRPDFWPLMQFALLSGVRLENCIGLRWDQIDWQAKTINFRVKSKRPGGRLLVLPLTEPIAQLLAREEGRNPELVFTYQSRRNHHQPGVVMQDKGKRYPFTRFGAWRKHFMAARAEIGLPQLRFHDLRHTAATRLLAVCGNLDVVRTMLGHADIKTTSRYAGSDTAQVRAAMEAAAVALAAQMPPKMPPRLVAGRKTP